MKKITKVADDQCSYYPSVCVCVCVCVCKCVCECVSKLIIGQVTMFTLRPGVIGELGEEVIQHE